MSEKQEALVKEFLSAWGDGTRKNPDKERILAMMSPDAEWTLWVGPEENLRRGHEAISEEIDREAPMMEFLNCGIRSIASNDGTVFTERTDKFVCMGKHVTFDLVAVFTFDADERITAWREYFDSASVAKSMGMDLEEINAQ
jgi:limonene-1,2-epoxide hydrolase